MDCKKLTADDLTSVMNLDSARTIWGEMMEDYFDIDPHSKRGKFAIAYEFPRARVKCHAMGRLFQLIVKDLEDMGADAGYLGEEVGHESD